MEQGNTKQQMHTQEAVTSAQPQPLRAHTGAYAGPFCGSEPTNLSWDTWLPPNSQSPHSATEGKKKMGIVPQCFNRWPLTSESRVTSGEGGTSDMIQRVIYKFSTMEILPTPQQQGIQCIVFWTNKETKFRWKVMISCTPGICFWPGSAHSDFKLTTKKAAATTSCLGPCLVLLLQLWRSPL